MDYILSNGIYNPCPLGPQKSQNHSSGSLTQLVTSVDITSYSDLFHYTTNMVQMCLVKNVT